MVGRVTPCAPLHVPPVVPQLRRSDSLCSNATREQNFKPRRGDLFCENNLAWPSTARPDDAAPEGARNFQNHPSVQIGRSYGATTDRVPQSPAAAGQSEGRAGIRSRAPFTADPLRLGLSPTACPCPVGTARLRRPRPRIASGGTLQGPYAVIRASRCAAERGADGASAPSLPTRWTLANLAVRHSSFGFIALCP